MRTDKELINILLRMFNSYFHIDHKGLCHYISRLNAEDIITTEEVRKLSYLIKKYIKSNNIFNLIIYNEDRIKEKIKEGYLGYYWSPGKKEPRIKYLNYILKRL